MWRANPSATLIHWTWSVWEGARRCATRESRKSKVESQKSRRQNRVGGGSSIPATHIHETRFTWEEQRTWPRGTRPRHLIAAGCAEP